MCGLVEQFYWKEVDEKQRVAGTSRFLRPDAISGCFFTPFAPSALGLFISCVSKKKSSDQIDAAASTAAY